MRACTLGFMRVEYGPDARARLKRFGRAVSELLDQELKGLYTRLPDELEKLDTQAQPPWWRVNLNDEHAAIFRLNGMSGLARGILVCDIVSARERTDELERYLAEREDVDGHDQE
jgi:hypothetical protein